MIIDFDQIDETVLKSFQGGEKEVAAHMFNDGLNKMMFCRLVPGSSIGEHTHSANSEIVYALSGAATIIIDGATEKLVAGQCHYCPKGHTHTIINDGDADLVTLNVVPQQ